jgi:CheY-like chemotaxis protein
MPRLLVIDDRDQTVEMCHRQLPELDTVTRCERSVPCQVCEERDRGCPLKCAHDYREAAEVLARLPALPDLVVLDLHYRKRASCPRTRARCRPKRAPASRRLRTCADAKDC